MTSTSSLERKQTPASGRCHGILVSTGFCAPRRWWLRLRCAARTVDRGSARMSHADDRSKEASAHAAVTVRLDGEARAETTALQRDLRPLFDKNTEAHRL